MLLRIQNGNTMLYYTQTGTPHSIPTYDQIVCFVSKMESYYILSVLFFQFNMGLIQQLYMSSTNNEQPLLITSYVIDAVLRAFRYVWAQVVWVQIPRA